MIRFLLAVLLAGSVLAQGATTVTGRLVDEDGAPIVGARVKLDSKSGEAGTWRDIRGKSDAEGKFHLRCGLVDGQVIELVVSGRGVAGLRRTLEGLEPGSSMELGDVEVLPAGSIAGHIIDAAGNPILAKGWRVTASYGPSRNFRAAATIDEQTGEFRFASLPDGPATVSAMYDSDLTTGEVETEVFSGLESYVELPFDGPDPARRVTIRLQAPRGTTVHGEDLVRLVDEDGTEQRSVEDRFGRGMIYESLAPGSYTAIVEDPRFERVEQVVEVGKRADIHLIGAASVKIEVIDSVSGRPIQNYALDVVYPEANVRPNRHELFEAQDAKPGDGVVPGIVPGRVAFVARVADRPDARVTLDRLVPGDAPTPVRLEVPVAQELRGKLVRPEGEEDDFDAVIEWTPGRTAGHTTGGMVSSNGKEIPSVREAIRVPPSGEFAFQGAGPGEHTLRVRWSEWLSKDVVVELPLSEPLLVERPPCGWVTGELEASFGLDPSEVALTFVENRANEYGGSYSYSGSSRTPKFPEPKGFVADGPRFRAGPLPASTFHVHGNMAASTRNRARMMAMHRYYDEDDALAEVRVAAGETTQLVIDVSKVFPCEAEVKIDTGGVPYGDLDIHMRSSNSSSHGGSLVFTSLNAGARYEVAIACENQGWSYGGHTYFTARPGKRQILEVKIPLVQRRVRVETEDGQPVADTRIHWASGVQTQVGRTDAAGHLDLTLVAGSVAFGLRAPDLVELDWEAGDDTLVVTLPDSY